MSYGKGEEHGVPDYVLALDASVLSDLIAEFLERRDPFSIEFGDPGGVVAHITLRNHVLMITTSDGSFRLQARIFPRPVSIMKEPDPDVAFARVVCGIAAHIDSLVLKISNDDPDDPDDLTSLHGEFLELQDLEVTITLRPRLTHVWACGGPIGFSTGVSTPQGTHGSSEWSPAVPGRNKRSSSATRPLSVRPSCS